mgnify:CR=1 FL=1
MVRTTQLRRATFGCSHNGGSMMSTDIEKRAQLIVIAANQDHRFASDFSSDVIAGMHELIDARCELPGLTEDSLPFKFEKAQVRVPGGGNCRGFSESRAGIVTVDDLGESVHELSLGGLAAVGTHASGVPDHVGSKPEACLPARRRRAYRHTGVAVFCFGL